MINKYYYMGILCAIVGKMLVTGLSIPEALVGLGIIGICASKEYLEKHKDLQEIKEITSKHRQEIDATYNKQNEVIAKMAIEIDNLRTTIGGVKLHQNMSMPRK